MNEKFDDGAAYIAIYDKLERANDAASQTNDPHLARLIFAGAMEAYDCLRECDKTDQTDVLIYAIENHVLELERDAALASLESLQVVVQQLEMRFAAERERNGS